MISIVDAQELRNVLRPTVYRPFEDRNDRGSALRQSFNDAMTNREQAPQSFEGDRSTGSAGR